MWFTDQIFDRFGVKALRVEMSIKDAECHVSLCPHGEMMESPHAGGVDFENMSVSSRKGLCFIFYHEIQREGFYSEGCREFF